MTIMAAITIMAVITIIAVIVFHRYHQTDTDTRLNIHTDTDTRLMIHTNTDTAQTSIPILVSVLV